RERGDRPDRRRLMAIRVVRLGTARAPGEGLRLGTVRRPPRGVPRRDFAKRDFYDVWVPDLAPSAPLVSWALATPWDDKRWKLYARKYVAEMKKPPASRLIELLAALSHSANFSVGCYCENEARCHRSLLRDLLVAAGAELR
ncbi:MAG TPA: DUF488 family protein, partial [Gemmatimonadaceae bacterium]|nr:DUF488 family protein [Gemmatimonadaceae bacterium]